MANSVGNISSEEKKTKLKNALKQILKALTTTVKKIDDKTCEAKRLYIKPEYRGKGYARVMLNTMLDKARQLGFKEVTFTTKHEVMKVGYELYKRMGFEEVGEKDGIVSMRMGL